LIQIKKPNQEKANQNEEKKNNCNEAEPDAFFHVYTSFTDYHTLQRAKSKGKMFCERGDTANIDAVPKEGLHRCEALC